MNLSINICSNCANLFESDSSSTGYRCGLCYFNLAPAERKMQRMETYPEIQGTDVCEHFKDRSDHLRTNLCAAHDCKKTS